MTDTPELILNVAHALGHQPLQVPPPRPELPIAPLYNDQEQALDLFSNEISKLSGEFLRLKLADLDTALSDLIKHHNIHKAAIWRDDRTANYKLHNKLTSYGIQLMPANADKNALATCDLGITTADFFIPETGTIGLLSSAQKPRPVSLLPRVHLAILTKADLRPNLSIGLQEFKSQPYLTLISGPSRTSDIELILTLGVHGPKNLVVWFFDDV